MSSIRRQPIVFIVVSREAFARNSSGRSLYCNLLVGNSYRNRIVLVAIAWRLEGQRTTLSFVEQAGCRTSIFKNKNKNNKPPRIRARIHGRDTGDHVSPLNTGCSQTAKGFAKYLTLSGLRLYRIEHKFFENKFFGRPDSPTTPPFATKAGPGQKLNHFCAVKILTAISTFYTKLRLWKKEPFYRKKIKFIDNQ